LKVKKPVASGVPLVPTSLAMTPLLAMIASASWECAFAPPAPAVFRAIPVSDPDPPKMNHLSFVVQVAPLQPDCLTDAKPGHGYKEHQRPVRVSQFHHDAEGLLRTDDDGFVVGL